MNVVGISASSRAWGNTDILVHHALEGAEREGAGTRFLRLTDFGIGSCTGCMSCVLKDRDCVVRDGLHDVLPALRWADAVIIGSPTYILGASGAIHIMRERLVRFGTVCREFAGKPGLAIAAAGISGWEPFALLEISLTFLCLGMPVVDQFVGYGQGPGEVFWDTWALARAQAGGAALARGETAYIGTPGSCPVCHFDFVKAEDEGCGRCVVCELPGSLTWNEGKLQFRPEPGVKPRWAEDRVRSHFEESLLPSGPRFRSRLSEIRGKLEGMKERGKRAGCGVSPSGAVGKKIG